MAAITLGNLSKVIKGRIIAGNNKSIIHIKTRPYGRLTPGGISFISKSSPNEDSIIRLLGHKGSCIITQAPCRLNASRFNKYGISIIEVSSMNKFLLLAKAYRTMTAIPFVQVIGSAGKTTTKEIIGAVLQQGLHPLVGLENDNLPDGVARNILRVNRQHKSAVLEAAMFGPGIIRQSTQMIKPEIAVITSIQRVHLLRFGSMQKIINYKAEILDVLSENSTLIVNGEDKNCAKLPFKRFKGNLLRYGFSDVYDIWASDIRRDGFRTYFTAHYKSIKMECMINIIGRYNVGNALAAILVGLKLGLTEDQIVKGLAAFKPVEGRLKLHKKNGAIIINDNFNANPDSTQLLIEELRSLSVSYPLVLVLGDIERPSNASANYSRRVHFAIGQQLAGINFKYVLAIGKWGKEYVRGAISSGMSKDKIEYFPTVEAARNRYRSLLSPGTVVVLKASVYTPVRRLLRS